MSLGRHTYFLVLIVLLLGVGSACSALQAPSGDPSSTTADGLAVTADSAASGDDYARAGDYESAIASYTRAINVDPARAP